MSGIAKPSLEETSTAKAEDLAEIDQLWSIRPPAAPALSWDERVEAFLKALRTCAEEQVKEAGRQMKTFGTHQPDPESASKETLESLPQAFQDLVLQLRDSEHPYLPLARFREFLSEPVPQLAVDAAANLCALLLENMAVDCVRRKERGLVLEEGAVQAERFPALFISELIQRHTPSPEPWERLLKAIAMVRMLLDLGIDFGEYDRTGYTSLSNEYLVLSACLLPGLQSYAELARNGGLVICGANAERRWSAARDVHCLLLVKALADIPPNSTPKLRRVGRGSGHCRLADVERWEIAYLEEQDLFELEEPEQHELKRRMNELPPYPLIIGTSDVERFMDEGRKRLKVRILSYLFMQGEPLDLNQMDAPVLRFSLAAPLPSP